jgi:hypothetical protein
MNDLEDFIKQQAGQQTTAKRSVLEPYKDEILKMKELGFTEKIILQFLSEKKNLTVSQQALNRFIRSRLNLNSRRFIQTIQKETESKSQETPPPVQSASKKTANGEGKFNWQEKIDMDDVI